MSVITPTSWDEHRPSWLASRPRPILYWTVLIVGAPLLAAVAVYSPRYAVGLLGGGAVLAGVLMSPLFGACLLVGLVPATSGLASGFPLPSMRLSEAVIGIVSVTLMATARRRDAVAWGKLDWVLLIYGLGWALFGGLANFSLHQHLTISQWGTVFGQLQFILVYRGVRVAIRSARDREIALGVAILSTIPVSLLAILQQLNKFGARTLIETMTGGDSLAGSLQGSSGGIRATGPFASWEALAGYLLPIMLVMIALGLSGVRPRHSKLFTVTGVLGAIALVLSDEQSIIICLLVGLAVLVRNSSASARLRRLMGVGGSVAVLAGAPIIVTRIIGETSGGAGTNRVTWIPQTLQYRWNVWTGQYLPALHGHLLFGYGVVYPDTITWISPESQYLGALMEGGIPMLALLLILCWTIFRTVWNARDAPDLDRLQGPLCDALLITVVSMFVVDFIWQFLSNGGLPQVLWALLALAIPVRHADRRGHERWQVRDDDARGSAPEPYILHG